MLLMLSTLCLALAQSAEFPFLRGPMLMRISGLMRLTLCALALTILPLASGCGGNPFNPPPDTGGPPDLSDTPLNDSPQNLMLRFERAYERELLSEYAKLFASNFRFTFSNQSDPTLVATYGNNWGKDDEIESTSHLFDGFNGQNGFEPGAISIQLSLDGAQFIDDPTHPDSAAHYKYVIVPSISLRLEVAGSPETQIYEINAPHDFYLVRGDAAFLDTDGSQPATADRWYIRRWDDKSPALGAVAPRLASLAASDRPVTTTWGNLKSTYVVTP